MYQDNLIFRALFHFSKRMAPLIALSSDLLVLLLNISEEVLWDKGTSEVIYSYILFSSFPPPCPGTHTYLIYKLSSLFSAI